MSQSDGQKFAKMILNSIMRALLNRVVWGLPLWLSVVLLALAIGAVWIFGTYK